MSTVSFVSSSGILLDQPCWIIVINLVTLDLLRSSMAHDPGRHKHSWVFLFSPISPFSVMTLRPAVDIKTRPRLSLPVTAKDTERKQPKITGPKIDSASKCSSAPSENVMNLVFSLGSLYYCGLQARIAPFVSTANQKTGKTGQRHLATRWDGVEGRNSPVRLLCHPYFVSDNSGSESEYSQIEENLYGETGYSVRWG